MAQRRTMVAGAVLALTVLSAGPAVAGCPPELPDVPRLNPHVVDTVEVRDEVEVPLSAPRSQ